MVRFDNMIRAGMTMREIRLRFPGTAAVFEEYGFRDSCDDCSIEAISRKYGLNSQDIVAKLNAAAFDGR
jgi:hypothetical protein